MSYLIVFKTFSDLNYIFILLNPHVFQQFELGDLHILLHVHVSVDVHFCPSNIKFKQHLFHYGFNSLDR